MSSTETAVPAKGLAPLALLVMAAIGIAAAWPIGATAVIHGSTIGISTVRYLTATLTVGALLLVRPRRGAASPALPRRAFGPLIGMGITVALYNLVFLLGLTWSNPNSGALIVSGVMPVAAATLGRWWTNERVSRRQVIGMVIAATGVVVVFLTSGRGGSVWADVIGGLLFVVGGVVWGMNTVLSRIALRHIDPLAATAWSVTFGLALLLPLALLTEHPGFAMDLGPAVWLAMLLGLVSTTIPLLCLLAAIRLLGVTRTAGAAFLVPIFAVLLNVVFLREVPDPVEVIGGAMAILGFVLIAA